MTGEIGRAEAYRKELLAAAADAAPADPSAVESPAETTSDARRRPAFAAARRLLVEAARRAARELEINRAVLSGAIRAREGRIRSLDPAAGALAPGYGGASAAAGAPSALLFSRTA
jgi:hypothetical protein